MSALPLYAQEATPAPRFVSDDEVNAVASRMYCPVCEYVPLDTCGEPACIVWKSEIRQQLAAGRTEDEIIAQFVARYGDRVVGVPQDEGLRRLSIIGPVVVGLIALVLGVATFLRWWGRPGSQGAAASVPPAPVPDSGDDYRRRLEADLERRG
ncbi:MAG: cytochrome c-type biogenesis protein CcmH [bacterium]|nr:cytochrome c-type biogenesis protein CcmH [bacterium]